MAAAKKSDNTDVVISSAAAALVKATASIQEAFKSVDGLNETAETLTRDIASKKAEVAGLDEQYQIKARQAEVDFNLKLQETKDKTVNEYLKSVGKEAILSTEYREIVANYARSVSERDAEVKKAVAIEQNRLLREYSAEKSLLISHNEIAKLFREIEAQRALTAEVAKAGSVGSINVGTPNNR